jgi:hypothetical protein
MSLRKRFFAATYDRQLAKVEQAGLHALRQGLIAQATGDVLERGTLPKAPPFVRPLIVGSAVSQPAASASP